MPYTLNSKKDSRGDEHLFMERFNQNRAAIEAYKRQHGGDLEGAYQRVTGEPWPEGRSVKIKNGVAEMTADRTTKSVLGKYVLPIAAGAITGGFGAAVLMGGGGAAAATGGGVAGGGLGTGALAAGATIPGAGMVSGVGGGLSLNQLMGLYAVTSQGGRVASDVYAARKAGQTNENVLELQERDSLRGQQMYQQSLALDKQRWADYVRAHEPQWQAGQQVLGSLYDLAGYQGGAPQYQRPEQPMGPAGVPTPTQAVARNQPPMAGMAPPMRPGTPGARPQPRPSGVPSLTDLMMMQQSARA